MGEERVLAHPFPPVVRRPLSSGGVPATGVNEQPTAAALGVRHPTWDPVLRDPYEGDWAQSMPAAAVAALSLVCTASVMASRASTLMGGVEYQTQ